MKTCSIVRMFGSLKLKAVGAVSTALLLSVMPANAAFQLVFDGSSSSTNASSFPTSGTAAFEFTDAAAGQVGVRVSVANTSTAPVTQSYVTALGFDFVTPETSYKTGSFVGGSHLDSATLTTNITGITLNFCAYATGTCNAGGGVSTGIPNGDSDMFSFILNSTLTAAQAESAYYTMFTDTYSKENAAIVMRWRGIQINGSGDGSETKYNPSVVPLPASALLLLAGLGGLGLIARQRRNGNAAEALAL